MLNSAAELSLTLRAALAGTLSLVLWLCCGARFIAWLAKRFREPIVGDSATLNTLHRAKEATPTVGGAFILAAILIAVLLFADLADARLIAGLLLICGLGAIGAIDDLLKVAKRSSGLSARVKLCAQIVIAAAVSLFLYAQQIGSPDALSVLIPGVGFSLSLGVWFIPLSTLVIVATSNATNLTDGLDGLAAGCLICAIGTLSVLASVTQSVAGSELIVLAAAAIGALAGFLRFNRFPARVFMGDTGSLPFGGLLGFLAVAWRQELMLAVIGGVFVIEALSVIAQVSVFKLRGRRLLRCAPLHHHFQFLGWPEAQIVRRFWLASGLFALIGLSIALSSPAREGPHAKARRRKEVARHTQLNHASAEPLLGQAELRPVPPFAP